MWRGRAPPPHPKILKIREGKDSKPTLETDEFKENENGRGHSIRKSRGERGSKEAGRRPRKKQEPKTAE